MLLKKCFMVESLPVLFIGAGDRAGPGVGEKKFPETVKTDRLHNTAIVLSATLSYLAQKVVVLLGQSVHNWLPVGHSLLHDNKQ